MFAPGTLGNLKSKYATACNNARLNIFDRADGYQSDSDTEVLALGENKKNTLTVPPTFKDKILQDQQDQASPEVDVKTSQAAQLPKRTGSKSD